MRGGAEDAPERMGEAEGSRGGAPGSGGCGRSVGEAARMTGGSPESGDVRGRAEKAAGEKDRAGAEPARGGRLRTEFLLWSLRRAGRTLWAAAVQGTGARAEGPGRGKRRMEAEEGTGRPRGAAEACSGRRRQDDRCPRRKNCVRTGPAPHGRKEKHHGI